MKVFKLQVITPKHPFTAVCPGRGWNLCNVVLSSLFSSFFSACDLHTSASYTGNTPWVSDNQLPDKNSTFRWTTGHAFYLVIFLSMGKLSKGTRKPKVIFKASLCKREKREEVRLPPVAEQEGLFPPVTYSVSSPAAKQ